LSCDTFDALITRTPCNTHTHTHILCIHTYIHNTHAVRCLTGCFSLQTALDTIIYNTKSIFLTCQHTIISYCSDTVVYGSFPVFVDFLTFIIIISIEFVTRNTVRPNAVAIGATGLRVQNIILSWSYFGRSAASWHFADECTGVETSNTLSIF